MDTGVELSADNRPARIADTDMAYHTKVCIQAREIDTIERQMATLSQRVQALRGAQKSWSEHLFATYALGPEDGVTEDGTIVYASPPAPAAPTEAAPQAEAPEQ